MPATVSSASMQTVLQAANHNSWIQCGSIAFTTATVYSAGVAKPLACPATPGRGVRAVLRMLVFTKRLS